MIKKFLLSILIILPFTAHAGLLGLGSQIKGEYNIDTDTSTLTSQIGKTIGMYGLSVTGDVDFDVMEFAYDGVDVKAEYDVLQLNNASVYVSSGLDTNWEMEDIKIGLEINF